MEVKAKRMVDVGQVVPAGATVTVDASKPRVRRLIDAGVLVEVKKTRRDDAGRFAPAEEGEA